MQVTQSIKACSAVGALAISLSLAAPAMAEELVTASDQFNASFALAPEAELPGAPYANTGVLAQASPQLPPATSGLPDPRPEWQGGRSASAAPVSAAPAAQLDPRARDAWLRECRRRVKYYYEDGYNRGGTGGVLGALLGGVAGGVIGNRIDDGPDRGVGTVVGAAAGAIIGAVAGSAIDKASSRKSRYDQGYDYCEAYLDDYYRYYSQAGYAGYGHGQMGYHGHMMMAPRMMMAPARVSQPAAQQPCEEVVTEEYVPQRTRVIERRAPRRAPLRRVPDKRIRVY